MPFFSQKSRSTSCSLMCSSRSTVKVEPLPFSLSTVIFPPIRSSRFLVIAMPRPVPWILLVTLSSSRVKAWKIFCWYSGLMP